MGSTRQLIVSSIVILSIGIGLAIQKLSRSDDARTISLNHLKPACIYVYPLPPRFNTALCAKYQAPTYLGDPLTDEQFHRGFNATGCPQDQAQVFFVPLYAACLRSMFKNSKAAASALITDLTATLHQLGFHNASKHLISCATCGRADELASFHLFFRGFSVLILQSHPPQLGRLLASLHTHPRRKPSSLFLFFRGSLRRQTFYHPNDTLMEILSSDSWRFTKQCWRNRRDTFCGELKLRFKLFEDLQQWNQLHPPPPLQVLGDLAVSNRRAATPWEWRITTPENHVRISQPPPGTTFCPAPPGDGPYRDAFYQAVLLGCIPVVFGELHNYLFIPTLLPIRAIAIVVSIEFIILDQGNLVEFLQRVPLREIKRLQAALRVYASWITPELHRKPNLYQTVVLHFANLGLLPWYPNN